MSSLNLKSNNSQSILLVIDLQERLLPSIKLKDNVIWETNKLIETANILDIPVIISEQSPNKLGKTDKRIKHSNDRYKLVKDTFSCGKCKELHDILKLHTIKYIIITGIESHICVQQTVIDLIASGYIVILAIDAISSRKEIDHEIAIRRMNSCGALISTVESIIFEWCETSNRKEFKDISSIVKKSRDN